MKLKDLQDDSILAGVNKLINEFARKGIDVDLYLRRNPYHLELSKIVIPKDKRNSGIGTSIMNRIVQFADSHGLKMSLTPDTSFGGSSKTRLNKFYKRFGFVDNKGRNKDYEFSNSMLRPEIYENLIEMSFDTKADIKWYNTARGKEGIFVIDNIEYKIYIEHIKLPILSKYTIYDVGFKVDSIDGRQRQNKYSTTNTNKNTNKIFSIVFHGINDMLKNSNANIIIAGAHYKNGDAIQRIRIYNKLLHMYERVNGGNISEVKTPNGIYLVLTYADFTTKERNDINTYVKQIPLK